MTVDTSELLAVTPALRRRFWGRLATLGILRPSQLIRIHRIAQDRGIAPEEAVVSLGMLTRDQAVEFLIGDAPFGFSWESLGAD